MPGQTGTEELPIGRAAPAAVKNDDETVTVLFKQSCGAQDRNCLEVPTGRFDVAARYYLPSEAIQTGAWTLPKIPSCAKTRPTAALR